MPRKAPAKPDAGAPPEGSTSPAVRHFHIHEGEPADRPRLAAWIRQAAALPGERCL
jgi:hypothetical protein